jgi:cytochrome P450
MQTQRKPLGDIVHAIDARVPRVGDTSALRRDPLAWLARARRRHGDAFVIADGAPLLSRARDCAGVVAVFGAERHRAVLADIDNYVLPISAAQLYDLPRPLVNLNAGLHGMRGELHAHDRRALANALAAAPDGEVDALVATQCRRWRRRSAVRLLDAMRALTLALASRVLFGDAAFSPLVLMEYFHLRRASTLGAQGDDADVRAALIRRGLAADAALRAWRRTATGDGALAVLARNAELSDDAFVAHANVAFISCYEPVAVALCWIVVLLSQRADLRAALRDAVPADGVRRSLVARVVDEALRLLTPNALMVRVTTAPVDLAGLALPQGSEVVLCPFLAHREPSLFPQPRRFMPERWLGPRPSPYDYFPFGAGGHACVGRALALGIIDAAVASIVRHADVVLAGDQAVDWRVHIMLTPLHDPVVRFRAPGRGGAGDAIFGGLLRLVDFK